MPPNPSDTDSTVSHARRLLTLVELTVSIAVALATLAELLGWL